jgi:hypothetical protein
MLQSSVNDFTDKFDDFQAFISRNAASINKFNPFFLHMVMLCVIIGWNLKKAAAAGGRQIFYTLYSNYCQ